MKKTHQRSQPEGKEPSGASPPGGPPLTTRAARGRRWWFPVAALLLIPLTLAVLELVLRVAGFGYPTDYFVRHPAAPAGMLVENQRFPWRFFPPTLARHPDPVALPFPKPAGAYRIFVFGESAAEGDPAPAFGFVRILEVMLRDRYPGVRFEVVNTAFTAISSHVILPIARQCAGLEGDLWVVYMGNNEVIGPCGVATVFGQRSLPLPAIRASLALKRTRTGQLFAALAGMFLRSEEAAKGWGGMSMFLEHQVPADDPRLAGVYANFERNLADLVELGLGSGAQVLVSTVASNLRDCAPFGSRHRPDLTPEQLTTWDRSYEAGVAAEAGGDWARALEAYDAAGRIDDRFADLWFRRGQCALGSGRGREARAHFERARDLDTLRFRTDARLNQIIRETTASGAVRGVRLVDVERTFADASPDGVPGEEWFYEHVHFTFTGNYRLARALADEVAKALPPAVTRTARAEASWLPGDDCARRLGYSRAQEHDVLKRVLSRLEEPIYRRQLNDAARRGRFNQRVECLRGESKPTARRRTVQQVREAVAANPEDPVLHELLARSLTAADDPDAALAAWREVASRLPHDATAYFESAQVLVEQARSPEAKALFLRAIEVNPDFAKAHEGLGLLCARLNRAAEAVRHLRQAVRLDPTRTGAAQALARLAGSGQP